MISICGVELSFPQTQNNDTLSLRVLGDLFNLACHLSFIGAIPMSLTCFYVSIPLNFRERISKGEPHLC